MWLLICVLFIAVIVDIVAYKIPNMCILIGLLTGFVRAYSLGGIEAVLRAAVLVLVVFALGYPFYMMRGIGAGDIKLLMVIACYLPREELEMCVLVTGILAGVMAMGKVIFFRESRERVKYFWEYLHRLVWCRTIGTYEVDRGNKRCVIRLSIPMLGSVLLQAGGIL